MTRQSLIEVFDDFIDNEFTDEDRIPDGLQALIDMGPQRPGTSATPASLRTERSKSPGRWVPVGGPSNISGGASQLMGGSQMLGALADGGYMSGSNSSGVVGSPRIQTPSINRSPYNRTRADRTRPVSKGRGARSPRHAYSGRNMGIRKLTPMDIHCINVYMKSKMTALRAKIQKQEEEQARKIVKVERETIKKMEQECRDREVQMELKAHEMHGLRRHDQDAISTMELKIQDLANQIRDHKLRNDELQVQLDEKQLRCTQLEQENKSQIEQYTNEMSGLSQNASDEVNLIRRRLEDAEEIRKCDALNAQERVDDLTKALSREQERSRDAECTIDRLRQMNQKLREEAIDEKLRWARLYDGTFVPKVLLARCFCSWKCEPRKTTAMLRLEVDKNEQILEEYLKRKARQKTGKVIRVIQQRIRRRYIGQKIIRKRDYLIGFLRQEVFSEWKFHVRQQKKDAFVKNRLSRNKDVVERMFLQHEDHGTKRTVLHAWKYAVLMRYFVDREQRLRKMVKLNEKKAQMLAPMFTYLFEKSKSVCFAAWKEQWKEKQRIGLQKQIRARLRKQEQYLELLSNTYQDKLLRKLFYSWEGYSSAEKRQKDERDKVTAMHTELMKQRSNIVFRMMNRTTLDHRTVSLIRVLVVWRAEVLAGQTGTLKIKEQRLMDVSVKRLKHVCMLLAAKGQKVAELSFQGWRDVYLKNREAERMKKKLHHNTLVTARVAENEKKRQECFLMRVTVNFWRYLCVEEKHAMASAVSAWEKTQTETRDKMVAHFSNNTTAKTRKQIFLHAWEKVAKAMRNLKNQEKLQKKIGGQLAKNLDSNIKADVFKEWWQVVALTKAEQRAAELRQDHLDQMAKKKLEGELKAAQQAANLMKQFCKQGDSEGTTILRMMFRIWRVYTVQCMRHCKKFRLTIIEDKECKYVHELKAVVFSRWKCDLWMRNNKKRHTTNMMEKFLPSLDAYFMKSMFEGWRVASLVGKHQQEVQTLRVKNYHHSEALVTAAGIKFSTSYFFKTWKDLFHKNKVNRLMGGRIHIEDERWKMLLKSQVFAVWEKERWITKVEDLHNETDLAKKVSKKRGGLIRLIEVNSAATTTWETRTLVEEYFERWVHFLQSKRRRSALVKSTTCVALRHYNNQMKCWLFVNWRHEVRHANMVWNAAESFRCLNFRKFLKTVLLAWKSESISYVPEMIDDEELEWRELQQELRDATFETTEGYESTAPATRFQDDLNPLSYRERREEALLQQLQNYDGSTMDTFDRRFSTDDGSGEEDLAETKHDINTIREEPEGSGNESVQLQLSIPSYRKGGGLGLHSLNKSALSDDQRLETPFGCSSMRISLRPQTKATHLLLPTNTAIPPTSMATGLMNRSTRNTASMKVQKLGFRLTPTAGATLFANERKRLASQSLSEFACRKSIAFQSLSPHQHSTIFRKSNRSTPGRQNGGHDIINTGPSASTIPTAESFAFLEANMMNTPNNLGASVDDFGMSTTLSPANASAANIEHDGSVMITVNNTKFLSGDSSGSGGVSPHMASASPRNTAAPGSPMSTKNQDRQNFIFGLSKRMSRSCSPNNARGLAASGLSGRQSMAGSGMGRQSMAGSMLYSTASRHKSGEVKKFVAYRPVCKSTLAIEHHKAKKHERGVWFYRWLMYVTKSRKQEMQTSLLNKWGGYVYSLFEDPVPKHAKIHVTKEYYAYWVNFWKTSKERRLKAEAGIAYAYHQRLKYEFYVEWCEFLRIKRFEKAEMIEKMERQVEEEKRRNEEEARMAEMLDRVSEDKKRFIELMDRCSGLEAKIIESREYCKKVSEENQATRGLQDLQDGVAGEDTEVRNIQIQEDLIRGKVQENAINAIRAGPTRGRDGENSNKNPVYYGSNRNSFERNASRDNAPSRQKAMHLLDETFGEKLRSMRPEYNPPVRRVSPSNAPRMSPPPNMSPPPRMSPSLPFRPPKMSPRMDCPYGPPRASARTDYDRPPRSIECPSRRPPVPSLTSSGLKSPKLSPRMQTSSAATQLSERLIRKEEDNLLREMRQKHRDVSANRYSNELKRDVDSLLSRQRSTDNRARDYLRNATGMTIDNRRCKIALQEKKTRELHQHNRAKYTGPAFGFWSNLARRKKQMGTTPKIQYDETVLGNRMSNSALRLGTSDRIRTGGCEITMVGSDVVIGNRIDHRIHSSDHRIPCRNRASSSKERISSRDRIMGNSSSGIGNSSSGSGSDMRKAGANSSPLGRSGELRVKTGKEIFERRMKNRR